jgi:FKBP-type peptidyl-prolyl cis-trans isomerase FkpA
MNWKILILVPLAVLIACGKPTPETVEESDEQSAPAAETAATHAADQGDPFEIAPGLSAQILKEGNGAPAQAGQIAVVHYTGWLYDGAADNKRGTKFDSSHDRDEYFSFMLGAGRVIRGWDQGVVGMKVGETRELTIAPEMGYGDRGAGNVIPPGATLVFEVELAELQGTQ